MNITISTLLQQWQRQLLLSYKHEPQKGFEKIYEYSMRICNISPNAQEC